MNARIIELAEQALTAVQNRPGGICEMDKYNQKFARLIVQDCVNVISDMVAARWPASTYIKNIKEHFGVEE